jgi:hypothetical protein
LTRARIAYSSRGVKGSKASLGIAPAPILHGADGRVTAEADAIHRGRRLIDWGE